MVPAGHLTQEELRAFDWYDPDGHGRHDAASLLAYVPREHSMQNSMPAIPVSVFAVPAGHVRQTLPGKPYWPAAHGTQAFPRALIPRGHTSTQKEDPGSATVPLPQATQLAPAPGDTEPSAHGVHDDAPGADGAVPGGHGEHANAPAREAYVPAAHAVQEPFKFSGAMVPGEHGRTHDTTAGATGAFSRPPKQENVPSARVPQVRSVPHVTETNPLFGVMVSDTCPYLLLPLRRCAPVRVRIR